MKYILTRDDFGHNVGEYITPKLEGSQRVKIGELNKGALKKADWVIRWGLLAQLPQGPRVINRRSAILETSNKGTFRKKVADAGLTMPTYTSVKEFMKVASKNIDDFKSVIVRPLHHQRSEDLVLANDPESAVRAFEKFDLATGGAYISEFIPKDKEYRVFVANGRAMIVAEKIPENRKTVSWGCVEQGELDYVFWTEWPNEVVECAIRAFNLSDLDFAAVDILWKDKKAFFLEANTAPEVWEYYGKCFAKVFGHMTTGDHGRDRIPVKDFSSWKETIHPAIQG